MNTVAKWSRHARAKARQHIDNDLIFLEINLRRILLVKLARKTLPLFTFNKFQKNLGRLYRHLDNFVNPSLITRNVPTEGDGGSPADTYSNLRELLKLVSDLARNIWKSPNMDLVIAPPDGMALFLVLLHSVAEVLGAIKECNTILRILFQDEGNSYYRPLHSPRAQSPLVTTFGNCVGAVLEALLQRYTTCEFIYELLLALSEKLDIAGRNIPDLILDILLLDCSREY